MSFPPPVYRSNIYGGAFSVASSESVTSLPAYSAQQHRPRTASAAREPTEHLFELKDKKQRAWATLKLNSSARSSSSLPTFLEGENLQGSVSLDLSHRENILGVTIQIRGSIVTGPSEHDRLAFLDISTPLWLKGMPNPRDTESDSGGRLSGDYHWPFSIPLPRDVILPDAKGKHGGMKTYQLPQTFLERTTRASVFYELFVHIARSTFRVDNKLQTMFVYVPAIRPEPPSQLRQMAYRQNGPLPGPDLDPEGWYTLPPTCISGKVFGNRRVVIQSVLSLAKPLSYTRGSVIPLSIIFACEDSQALNLVCTSRTINLILQRYTAFSHGPAGAEFAREDIVHLPDGPRALDINHAVWWSVPVADSTQTCRFDGELHLPKSLKPSSSVSHFSISYRVVLRPFQVTGFVPDNPKAPPSLQQEVQIATIYAKGPKPRCFTPPTYEYEIGDNLAIPPARSYI
ncbi:hypothetical protein MIND_00262700 [Mycena indigotica]|uniref:Arrestin-like N-terminal domain-containing protein n=1 Tax=Mycena indigotica TaxID=2126181 RepID=A0A8H6TAV0_9AGAR|nr:uncharacterized protein MIND_00262700 [Mycena indigotica]KAF7312490.1 hypothetical protein MIND_00262700 [Mycena indigotica]